MDILFLTTEELKKYIAADAGMRFETLKGFIQEATLLYIVDELGEAQLTTLQAAYTDGSGTPADADLSALLPYVQRPLAYYAMYLAVDQLAVNVGDGGITESNSQNSNPAPKDKRDSLKAHYLRQADLHIEKLLAYLEANASPTKYNEWYSSSAYTGADGAILNTVTQADQHIDINSSRRIFKRLKKRSLRIERSTIKRLIGPDQYDELITQIKTDTLKNSATNLALVALLYPIIAKKALYETLPSMRVSITDDGIKLISGVTALLTSQEMKALMLMLKEGDTGFEADMAELNQYIADNIDSYPLIKASTAYTNKPDPGPRRPPANSPDSKHFSV